MRTIKLTLAYDGTDYAGWQAQPDCRTVQETLEAAIERVTGRKVRVLASGRTDAGVHALGQVVGVRLETHLSPAVLRRALNAVLPHDVAVLEASEARDGFHAIRDAVRKRYRYVIHDGPVREVFRRSMCWHYKRGRLNTEAMDRAAAALLGTHDFSSFQTSGAERETTVRTVSHLRVTRSGGWPEDLQPPGEQGRGGEPENLGEGDQQGRAKGRDWIVAEIEADGFLYNMVRAIAGTLVEVGRGAQGETWPAEVLLAADRKAAGPTAPPQGLFLVRVDYES
ncbi:MAG: tRNA pseudouridine(38-40) synthase TruA [Pirellulales bacterium]|nr:tRNA pseudouridine(38-40) synthase TruA [Pirellulales bacterium]